ncbi:hypothetical protein BD560DRAFT_426961 [Blakeslea trispora]|nr:hypothetical protein BD560DRAFT_426961 [Blakeslea trispora]
MGSFISKEKADSKDFEQILSKLDKDIQKTETTLTELKIKQRKASFLWIIYSLVVWIFCLVYLFYAFVNPHESMQPIVYASLPVVGLPIIIYHVRKLLVWWYETRQKKEEAELAKLRKEQKEKIEDLKKKTSYYTTQSLLEKYDDALQKKKKEEQARQQQQQQQQKKPVSMPVRQPPPQQQQQQQQARFPMQPTPQMQPILPPVPTEPQWYDRIVDALVGDAGPETKYALICNHCFSHNGLVMKEEFDTIQYVCPHCKQFNPSRQSKHIVPPKPDQENKEEENDEEVLEKLKASVLQDNNQTIGSRVRQRHAPKQKEDEDEEE